MPQLDVTDILLDPEFAERFTVLRRTEIVTSFGKSVVTSQELSAIGVITAGPDDRLTREADYQAMTKSIVIVTKFPLRGPAPGFQADIILWHGDKFLISLLDDYSGYGPGFVQANADSIDTVDIAPAPVIFTGMSNAIRVATVLRKG
jgi:galactose-6-phosphate isomerase